MTALLLILALQAPPTEPQAPKFDLAVMHALTWGDTSTPDWISHITSGLGGSWPCLQKRESKQCTEAGIRVAAVSAIAETVKRSVRRWRPDLSDDLSFFSQHTAIACSGVLEKRGQAVSIALCLTTGYLRIAAQKHWLTDVLTGIAVGWFVAQKNGR